MAEIETGKTNVELEAKFLDIDKEAIIGKLKSLGAVDLGEDLLREIIFYDQDLNWMRERHTQNRLVRLRQSKDGLVLAYKHQLKPVNLETKEIELKVDDVQKTTQLLEEIGLVAYRRQEKKRHAFVLDHTHIDIDTWPSAPPLLEIEAETETEIRHAAKQLGLDWAKAVFENSGAVLRIYYDIHVGELHDYTFSKIG